MGGGGKDAGRIKEQHTRRPHGQVIRFFQYRVRSWTQMQRWVVSTDTRPSPVRCRFLEIWKMEDAKGGRARGRLSRNSVSGEGPSRTFAVGHCDRVVTRQCDVQRKRALKERKSELENEAEG